MDKLYAPTRLRIRKRIVGRLSRRLSYNKCTMRVAVGEEVAPTDILAECKMPPGFEVIHLANILGVSPKEANKYLKRGFGQNIYQGELLASKKELFGLKDHNVLSPLDGVLDRYDDLSGDLRIKFLPKINRLASGVYGVVEKIDGVIGTVVVKTAMDVVYGLFGSGKEREGKLRILGSSGMLTSSKQISHGMENQILVAGGIIFLEGLKNAVALGVSGIITGGINASDYMSISGGISQKRWSDIGTTVLVTEGFGSIPIGEDIYLLLTFHQGKFAIIQGNQGRIILPSQDKNSMMIIRKTNLSSASEILPEPESSLAEVRIGTKVRVVLGPFLGKQGVVSAIDQSLTKLPSGVLSYLVTVEGRSSKFQAPDTNLEIIG